MIPGPTAHDGERLRLLRRLQTDVQQVVAEIAQVREQTRVLPDAGTVRPLTPEELRRERGLGARTANHLHLRLRHLWAEFDQVQRRASA